IVKAGLTLGMADALVTGPVLNDRELDIEEAPGGGLERADDRCAERLLVFRMDRVVARIGDGFLTLESKPTLQAFGESECSAGYIAAPGAELGELDGAAQGELRLLHLLAG